MASALCNKWQIESSDNFDEYMKVVGVTDENRALANEKFSGTSNLIQVISNDGDNWSIKTITSLGEREVKFKIGDEFDSKTLDGRAIKVIATIDGDSLVETNKGDGFMSVNRRKMDGDKLVMTMTAEGVTCTRIYKTV